MADTTTITINREKAYAAFEAEGIIKAGTDLETFEFKASLDLNITAGTLAFTTALAGLKIEGKMLAAAFTIDKGQKYEMFNGISYFGAQAKAKAMLAHAQVLLNETRSVLADAETSVAAMRSSVTQAAAGQVIVKNAVQVVI